jgi:DNA helicase-2/ATP-dependent DNA helicase PcrA
LTSSELYEERKTKAKVSLFVSEALGQAAAAQGGRLPSSEVLAMPAQRPPVEKEKPPPTSFSPSALETYQSCPKKYHYQYVLKIKVPNSHFSNFGVSIHETLRRWFLCVQQQHPANIEEIYKESWVKGGYES